MTKRMLEEGSVQRRYFEQSGGTDQNGVEQGSRELRPLYPFVISGGQNTEQYYFKHATSLTQYKFNVLPQFFGMESEYTKKFPFHIEKIIQDNPDAQIFCVFDMDTVTDNASNRRNHELFCKKINEFIESGQVVLCPSMPCFEYWLLLHFQNETSFMKNRGDVMDLLAPHMKSYFIQPSDGKKSLGRILKNRKYLETSEWAKKLFADNKLESAINRAKANNEELEHKNCLGKLSYSKVFLAFEKANI
ncbi:MAG: RloB family protein [Fibrobacter sp.]|nr:RloB family protein [Fibrobacter sp.]